MDVDGIVTRGGALPHWYMPGFAHFVTYRLFDTIPKVRLQEMAQRRSARIESPQDFGLPVECSRAAAHKLFFREFDEALETNTNSNRRWLEQPEIAKVVRENLHHHHGSLYELLAWCIMPNHVHILIQPFESTELPDQTTTDHDSVCSDEVADAASPLSRIMHSLKSYTANEANRLLGRTGTFWQRESYDHWVRDLDELERIVDYIRLNPVKAGLCKLAHEWVFSSAHDRFCLDGAECGLVGKLRDDWRR
jgi:putative DNA methylase